MVRNAHLEEPSYSQGLELLPMEVVGIWLSSESIQVGIEAGDDAEPESGNLVAFGVGVGVGVGSETEIEEVVLAAPTEPHSCYMLLELGLLGMTGSCRNILQQWWNEAQDAQSYLQEEV